MSGDGWFWFIAGMWVSIGLRDLGEYMRARKRGTANGERS